MSELRRNIDKKISNMTGPFTIRDLLPDAETKTLNTGSVYLNELMHKGVLNAAGKSKRLRIYEPNKPKPATPYLGPSSMERVKNCPSSAETAPDSSGDAISEHQMGQAIYDLITELKNDLAAAKRELSTEKTQAKLRSAEYAKQLREKTQELKDLRDEIELLERRAQRVVRVPRMMDRQDILGNLR